MDSFWNSRQTVARQIEISQTAAVAESIATHRMDAVVADRERTEDEEAAKESITDGGDAVVLQVQRVKVEKWKESVGIDGFDKI